MKKQHIHINNIKVNKCKKDFLIILLSLIIGFSSFGLLVFLKSDNYVFSAEKNCDGKYVVEHNTKFEDFAVSVERENDTANKKLMNVIEQQKFSSKNKFAGIFDMLFVLNKKNYINTYYADGNGGVDIYIANGYTYLVRDGYNPKCKFQTGHFSVEVYKSDGVINEKASDFIYDDENEHYVDSYTELSAFYKIEVKWYIPVIVISILIFILIKFVIALFKRQGDGSVSCV